MESTFLSRTTLSDQVTHHVIRHIRERGLRAGDPLPAEGRVSESLGVSRGIVREAYRSLEAAGIIVVANGKSPRVGELNPSAFALLLDHAISTEQVSPAQVLQLRRALEVEMVRMAAEYRSDDDLRELHTLAREMRQARSDMERWATLDAQFHLTLAGAAQNPLYRLFIAALREPLEGSIKAGLKSRTSKAQLDRVLELHDLIVEAVGQRKADRAAKLMSQHFDEAVSSILHTRAAKGKS